MTDERMTRALIAEQMLDNLRERLGEMVLDEDPVLLGREDIMLLLDLTRLPAKEARHGA